jgi:hypothetical protein
VNSIEFSTGKLTIGLSTRRSSTLADNTLVLEVEVPALFLAAAVLQGEGDDSLGGLDSILALGLIALEAGVDHVEGGGRRETVYANVNRKRFIDSTGRRPTISFGQRTRE